jgi:diguanylate cyclase (GGDEF)-like protein
MIKMAGIIKKLSLIPAGLRYKLTVVFVLMSFIPLAICVYLAYNFIYFPFLQPNIDLDFTTKNVSLVIGLTILIALLGFKIIWDIASPIIDMAIKARGIANGDYSRSIEVKSEDEVGELGITLNTLTRRIRENMDELRSYGERTKEINVEINKKVLIMSGLLQVSNLISQGASLDEILKIAIEKISQAEEDSSAFLMLTEEKNTLIMKENENLSGSLNSLRVKIGTGLLGKLVAENKMSTIDRRSRMTPDIEEFLKVFSVKNCLLCPIVAHGHGFGIVGLCNTVADYEFREEDTELIKLFGKQMAIAVENEILTAKAKELAIKDELTGLYNEKFIISRLEEEIKRAALYQRPCSFLIFNIDDLNLYRDINGELAAEDTIKKIGKIIESNITEVDRVGRLSGDTFAVILPEKNKKQANTAAEVLKQRVEAFGIAGGKGYPRNFVTVSGGVSENPIDGVSAEDLIKKATLALNEAKSKGKNTIVS